MPAKSISIIWTALPAGLPESNVLRLSVHVSPRLETDEGGARPTLELFRDYFGDWPEVVRNLRFQVRFNPGPTLEARPLTEPSSELWQAVFPLDTYVRPYEFRTLNDRLIFSYPVGNVLAHLQGIYQRYAQSAPESFPGRDVLRGDVGLRAIRSIYDPDEAQAIDRLLGQRQDKQESKDEMLRQLTRAMLRDSQSRRAPGKPANAVPPGPPAPEMDFFQATHFFTPQSKLRPERTETDKHGVSGVIGGEYERLPAEIPLPDIDFHQIVSTLGQFPVLLRQLGLVIDLDLRLDSGIVGSAPAPDQPAVQIIPVWPGGAPAPLPVDIRPKTVYLLDDERFLASSHPYEQELSETGLLRLDKEGYHLVQVDVDGAAIKAMNFSRNLHRSILHRSAHSDLDSSLPSLRSMGFALARTGAASRLATKLHVMTDLQSNLGTDPEPTLYAEDVLRGYRVDVWDSESGAWRSLHQRIGDYAFDAGLERTYRDEGFTETAATSSADGTSTDLFLHEIFASWEGWSLSAPRPGAWLTDESGSERERKRANTELDMETTFRVLPGSLPKLRFGTRYRLRVRGVDLAGNSPTFEALVPDTAPALTNPLKDSDPAASEEQTYFRFEPLSPPVVVLRNEIQQPPLGESLEHVVIRSFNDEPAKDELPTEETADRHLAPPKGPWSLAESHGMLDLPEPQASDPERLKDLHTLIVTKDANFPSTETGEAVNPIVARDTIAELPYLPDPIARGASLINLPGLAAGQSYRMAPDGSVAETDILPHGTLISLAKVDFRPGPDDAWFDVGAFRIQVVDATGRPDLRPRWDSTNRVLTVYLPKAEVARVPYSCFLGADDLELMGMWEWIKQAEPKEYDLEILRQRALDGRHWMITPRRMLVLVHAVQQPLHPPAFSDLTPQRSLGNTYATLVDRVRVHAKSTIKLDVRAQWNEWIDPLAEPGPRQITGSAHVCEVNVEDRQQDVIGLSHRHEFGDTKYRKVLYRGTATTRYREYLPEALRVDEANITRTTIDEPVEADEMPYGSPVIDVPNAARPDAPKLLYVVPAFRWSERSGTMEGLAVPRGQESMVSRREGGWLRVYLERPWYSSGDGELLGALFWTDEFRRIPSGYRSYVTQWGTDPIWASAPTSGAAAPANFRAAVATKIGGLTLEELTPASELMRAIPAVRRFEVRHAVPRSQTQLEPAATIEARPEIVRAEEPLVARAPEVAVPGLQIAPTLAVAGHDVRYDPDRQLWYADIHIDAGPSYFPFVRLALARFQPISVANAHISRVVLADFAQLAPDRTASLTFDPRRRKEVQLAVYGPTYERSEAVPQPPRIIVRVETLRPDVPEELGWVPAEGAEVELSRVRFRGERPLWTGKIKLPVDRGTQRFRAVIEEHEEYLYQPGAPTAVRAMRATRRASRLVYAHALEL